MLVQFHCSNAGIVLLICGKLGFCDLPVMYNTNQVCSVSRYPQVHKAILSCFYRFFFHKRITFRVMNRDQELFVLHFPLTTSQAMNGTWMSLLDVRRNRKEKLLFRQIIGFRLIILAGDDQLGSINGGRFCFDFARTDIVYQFLNIG